MEAISNQNTDEYDVEVSLTFPVISTGFVLLFLRKKNQPQLSPFSPLHPN